MTQKSVKLTSRGQYAIMTMVELAKTTQTRPVPLADIADRSAISLSYLEQLISGLRRHDLVKSYRGPGGGYILSRPSSEIIITDILLAAEDNTPARKSKNASTEACKCIDTLELWHSIGTLLHSALQQVSLADVVSGNLPHALNI